MLNPDSNKKVSVRIVHLYARVHPECMKKPQGETQVSYDIAPDKKRMTHLYFTHESPLTVEKVENLQ
jgi:hypothetical protein